MLAQRSRPIVTTWRALVRAVPTETTMERRSLRVCRSTNDDLCLNQVIVRDGRGVTCLAELGRV
jgi:hypothetical protein